MRIRLPVTHLVSVLLFAALCAITAVWALQLLAPRAPIAPVGAVAQAQPPVDLAAAGGLFGGAPQPVQAAAAAPSNVQVAGVVAAGPRSVALLAVDGKPARAFALGETVGDGLRVRSVTADAVELDRGGQPVRLAAPPRASIDVLTRGAQAGPAAAGAPQTAPPAPPPPASSGLLRASPAFGVPPPPPSPAETVGAASPPMMSAPAAQSPVPQAATPP
jgi:general secretion pathway protein C